MLTMHRDHLLHQLDHYHAQFPEESDVTGRFIQFIRGHADCFERSLKIGHITGSVWLVNAAGTHVLLTHHRKLNKWFQLGGHADGDSDVLRVSRREVLEESGIEHCESALDGIFDLDIHPIPARGDEPLHDHFDVRFALRVIGNETYTVSDESHDLAWVEIATLKNVTTEQSMQRMARKWKALSAHAPQ